MKKTKTIIFSLIIFLLAGCAGINPNTGERTEEDCIESGKFDEALQVLCCPAERGEPWAQVQLGDLYGGLYEVGDIISQDYDRARLWYLRAAVQTKDSRWAKGKCFLSYGRNGWYGQNLYAYNAQAFLGEMLYEGKGIHIDRIEAYLWLNNAIKGVERDTGEKVKSFLPVLQRELTKEEWEQIRKKEINWSPINSKLYKANANRLEQ